MVFCFLLYHCIGAIFTNIMIPVCERRVTTFPAWSESTKTLMLTGLPLGSGIFGGNKSSESGYSSFIDFALSVGCNSSGRIGTQLISKSSGSKISHPLVRLCLIYLKTFTACCRWPLRGAAIYWESKDDSCSISVRPSSHIHLSIPIRFWYIVVCSSLQYGVFSSSGL